jgi:uncharacterized phage protein (TIGR02218 family)
MKAIPSALLADLKADCTTLAFLWTIEMANGAMIRGTEHDQDITIPLTGDSPVDKYAGTYKAVANVTMQDISNSSDLTVDNLDVKGAFPDKTDDSPQYATVIDVTAAEIDAGLLDMAPVTILVCNWQTPAHGYWIEKSGVLGQITRTSDGSYTTEVRGITQLLQQNILRTFSATCNVVKFGDARCKYAVPSVSGTVGAASGASDGVYSQIQFPVDLDTASPPVTASFVGGILTFTSGENAGFFREVKIDPNANLGIIQFWEAFPNPVSPDDEFDLEAGCDRTLQTCRDVYNNLPNFRGFGVFIPGIDALTAGPTTTDELQ